MLMKCFNNFYGKTKQAIGNEKKQETIQTKQKAKQKLTNKTNKDKIANTRHRNAHLSQMIDTNTTVYDI